MILRTLTYAIDKYRDVKYYLADIMSPIPTTFSPTATWRDGPLTKNRLHLFPKQEPQKPVCDDPFDLNLNPHIPDLYYPNHTYCRRKERPLNGIFLNPKSKHHRGDPIQKQDLAAPDSTENPVTPTVDSPQVPALVASLAIAKTPRASKSTAEQRKQREIIIRAALDSSLVKNRKKIERSFIAPSQRPKRPQSLKKTPSKPSPVTPQVNPFGPQPDGEFDRDLLLMLLRDGRGPPESMDHHFGVKRYKTLEGPIAMQDTAQVDALKKAWWWGAELPSYNYDVEDTEDVLMAPPPPSATPGASTSSAPAQGTSSSEFTLIDVEGAKNWLKKRKIEPKTGTVFETNFPLPAWARWLSADEEKASDQAVSTDAAPVTPPLKSTPLPTPSAPEGKGKQRAVSPLPDASNSVSSPKRKRDPEDAATRGMEIFKKRRKIIPAPTKPRVAQTPRPFSKKTYVPYMRVPTPPVTPDNSKKRARPEDEITEFDTPEPPKPMELTDEISLLALLPVTASTARCSTPPPAKRRKLSVDETPPPIASVFSPRKVPPFSSFAAGSATVQPSTQGVLAPPPTLHLPQ